MAMLEPNLIDFLMTVINGIEYGSMSTTNRSYQWMKNNSSLNGPCLNYLKNYVTHENFVTQKELELYEKLEKQSILPSEEEIDRQLEEYFDTAEINEFEFDNLQNYSEVLKCGDSYLRELNLADQFLRRKENDLEVKIKVEERKKELNESEMKNIFQRSDELNDLYNEILKSIQCELLKITSKFDRILKENSNQEEHNIFHINFEIFKQINSTFLDTVRVVMEKQFSSTKKNVASNREDGFEVEDDRKHIESLIQVAYCFGERSFENIQYQCEEAECQHLNEFITNLSQDVESKPPSVIGSAQLQSQAAANLETVEEIQEKLSSLSKNLEQYFKNFLVYEIFTDERNQIESKLRSDKKRLRKVLDLCVRFVDLLTLQAFLLENERDNVDLAIQLHRKAVSTLDDHLGSHSDCVRRVEKMLQSMKIQKSSNSNVLAKCGADLLTMDLDSMENISVEKVSNRLSAANHEILDKIRTLADKKLTTIGMLKNNINRLDTVLFSGPARQPFFRGSLIVDKRFIESQCSDFNKIFHGLKKDYKDELEKLSTDEYIKMEKSLWIMFLTDPQAFQMNLQKFRDKAGINKTLILKKNESSSLLAKKSNRSSYY